MFVYILRHAWAGHFGDPRWPDDRQRPLTAEGKGRFTTMAQLLVERGMQPNIIATSPYARCKQTAEIVSLVSPGRPEVVSLDALRPGSDLDALLKWSDKQNCEQILWVGHAPDVGQLVAGLISLESDAAIRFAKAACAAVRCDGVPSEGGELYWQLTAKMLGC